MIFHLLYFILFYFIVFYFISFILAVLADGGAYPRYHPLLQEQNIKYSGFSDLKSKTLLDSLTFYSTVSSGVSVVRVHLCVGVVCMCVHYIFIFCFVCLCVWVVSGHLCGVVWFVVSCGVV